LKKHVRAAAAGTGKPPWLKDVEAQLQKTDSELTFLATTRGKAGEPLRDIALAARQTSAELNSLTE
jgi:hypothetical protein